MKQKFKQAMTQTRNSNGREFYVAFPYNDSKDQPGQNLAIYVTSSVNTTVNIYNAALGLDVTKNVKAHEITEFSTAKGGLGWDSEIYTDEKVVPEALKITSPDAIAVYCMNSKSVTSEGYLAIPINFWGKEYIHDAYYDFDEVREWAGGFCVIAQEDYTNVTIRVVDGANKQKGFGKTQKGHQHGDVVNINMMAGDVYMMQGDGKTMAIFDLSGSIITSDKPIGLLSYHNRTTIPQSGSNNGRDHIIEMMPPVQAWGTEYATVEYDRGSDKGDFFRVVAGEDNVTFTADWYEKDGGGNNKKIGSFGPIKLLKKGDWFEYNNAPVVAPHDLESIRGVSRFKADGKILVMQYSYSANYDNADAYDPFMIIVTPVEQYTKETIFQTPANYGKNEFRQNFFNLIAIGDTTDPKRNFELLNSITIDKQRIVDIQPSFSGNRIPGTNLYWAFILSLQQGTHSLKGNTPFGGYIYGFADFDSYGWPAATAFGNLAEIDTLPPIVSFPPGCYEWLVNNIDDPKNPRNGKEGDNPRQVDVGVREIPTLLPGSYNFDPPVPVDKNGNEIAWSGIKPNYDFDYKIKVTDPYQNAMAILHVADDVGNATDTTIIYNVDQIKADPNPITYGKVRIGTEKKIDVKITSESKDTIDIEAIKLKQGKVYKIATDLSFIPFKLLPGKDTTISVAYNPVKEYIYLNKDPKLQFDFDTLVVTTGCLEWEYAIDGQGVQPLIQVEDYDAEIAQIGSFTTTKTTQQNGIFITNKGTSDLIVTGLKNVILPFTLPNMPPANVSGSDITFATPITVKPGVTNQVKFGHTLLNDYMIKFEPSSTLDADNSIDVQFVSNTAEKSENTLKDDISRWHGSALASGPVVIGTDFPDTRVNGVSNTQYVKIRNLLPPGETDVTKGEIIKVLANKIKLRLNDGNYIIDPAGKIQGFNSNDQLIYPDIQSTISLYVMGTPASATTCTEIRVPVLFTPTAKGSLTNDVVVNFENKPELKGRLTGRGFIPELSVSNQQFDPRPVNSGLHPTQGRLVISNTSKPVDGERSYVILKSIQLDNTSPSKNQFSNFLVEGTNQPIDQVKDLQLNLDESLVVTYDFSTDGATVGPQYGRLKVLSDAGPANSDKSDPTADNKYDATFDGRYTKDNQTALDDGGYIQAELFSVGLTASDVNFGSVSLCDLIPDKVTVTNNAGGDKADDEIINRIEFVSGNDVFEFSNFSGKIVLRGGGTNTFDVQFKSGTPAGTYSGQYIVICQSDTVRAQFNVKGTILTDLYRLSLEEYTLRPGDEFNMNVNIKPLNGSSFDVAKISRMEVTITYKPEWLEYRGTSGKGNLVDWVITEVKNNVIIGGENWVEQTFTLEGNGKTIPAGNGGVLFSPKFMYLLHDTPEGQFGNVSIHIEPKITRATFGERDDCIKSDLLPGKINSSFCIQKYRALDLIIAGNGGPGLAPISPNPVSNTMNLKFLVSSESKVTLELTDLHGEVVKVLYDAPLKAGQYESTADVSDVPSGAYFLTYKYLGVSESQKIMITK
ncbi:T9SS type A sorting domain-containing protein [bacterium]|nr:MAG: T9SS type A sorting domain-containing protein [bacterium]